MPKDIFTAASHDKEQSSRLSSGSVFSQALVTASWPTAVSYLVLSSYNLPVRTLTCIPPRILPPAPKLFAFSGDEVGVKARWFDLFFTPSLDGDVERMGVH